MFSSQTAFDYRALLDELRRRETEWLKARQAALLCAERRLHVERLAVLRVLEERGKLDDTLAQDDGVSIRSARDQVATAKALEWLPKIAAVAAEGLLSDAQLTQVVKLVDAGDVDGEERWAREAPSWSPADLAQQVRIERTPSTEEGQARRAARELRFWWRRDAGMLDGHFSLPDVDGALFESVLNQMIDRMKPAERERWETRARRGADALIELVRNYADVESVSRPPVHMVVHIPASGPATIAGIPLPDDLVESLRARAKVEPVLLGEGGEPIVTGRTTSVISAKRLRAVRLRDGKCRWPGCDRRTGLEAHHLWPASWGGPDEIHNLAMVCTGGSTDHHAKLAPHGPWLLRGNPNQPNGLRLVHREDLARGADLAAPADTTTAEARAGPTVP